MSDEERCGTPAGYMAHRRAGEATCARCRVAWREYYRARRRTRGETTK